MANLRRNRQRAFTLIEMFVVAGIIALLAALILPALSRAKESARSVVCINNLRQLGIALESHTSEWGYYPAGQRLDLTVSWAANLAWNAHLLPFVSSNTAIFKCPSTSPEFAWTSQRKSRFGYAFPFNVDVSMLTPEQPSFFSYGYNQYGTAGQAGLGLDEGGSSEGMPTSRVRTPADMIGIADSDGFGSADGRIGYHRLNSSTRAIGPVGTRHRAGGNVVFCDGHVEWGRRPDWMELTETVAKRWNNDHLPHRDTWFGRPHLPPRLP